MCLWGDHIALFVSIFQGVITGPVTVGATPGDRDPTLLPSTTGATEVTNQLVRSYPSNRYYYPSKKGFLRTCFQLTLTKAMT